MYLACQHARLVDTCAFVGDYKGGEEWEGRRGGVGEEGGGVGMNGGGGGGTKI